MVADGGRSAFSIIEKTLIRRDDVRFSVDWGGAF